MEKNMAYMIRIEYTYVDMNAALEIREVHSRMYISKWDGSNSEDYYRHMQVMNSLKRSHWSDTSTLNWILMVLSFWGEEMGMENTGPGFENWQWNDYLLPENGVMPRNEVEWEGLWLTLWYKALYLSDHGKSRPLGCWIRANCEANSCQDGIYCMQSHEAPPAA